MENSTSYLSFLPLIILVGVGILLFAILSKRPIVYFKNPNSGEMESLKVGFNFFLFLFGAGLFGLFLFLRGLKKWGLFCLLFEIIGIGLLIITDINPILASLFYLSLIGLSIFFGVKGNEMTGKNLLRNGFEFIDPENKNVILAKIKWNISES